jgi:phosphomannomutase
VSISSPPASIFKAYDVRGLYGEEIDEETAYVIGRAFARVLADLRGKPSAELVVGLGRDMRLESPGMARGVADGLTAEGVSVLDAGMVATEVLYHLVGGRELDGGAAVTASHNPKAYTGMKLVREGALALSGDAGIGELRELIERGMPQPPGGGSIEPVDVDDGFRRRAMSFIEPRKVRPMKVVVDGSNGMAGPTVGPVLRELPLKLVELYFEPDPEFPDHEPNPLLEENRRLITERVLAEQADLGIAWDGDADRCFFIDDAGRFVDGDFLTALLAESLVEKRGGGHVLYDVRASRAVPDTVAAAGGTSDVNRVGHAFFKIRMRETGAIFGGEVSGHYYFRDFHCADSGTIPALLILELVSEKGVPMSELIDRFRSRYFISGEINSEVADQEAKMEEVAGRYSDGEIQRMDGISVDYPDWHFNLRPSNTEPLLRLNLESLISVQHMADKRDELLSLIRA